jgi:hypothetical protein
MSGFGAPARTARPTADRVMLVCVPGSILPPCASASSSGRGNSAISNVAPASISFVSTDVGANRISTLSPLARSNSGAASTRSGRMAPPLRILMMVAMARL